MAQTRTTAARAAGQLLLAALAMGSAPPATAAPAPLSWHTAHAAAPGQPARGINTAARLLSARGIRTGDRVRVT